MSPFTSKLVKAAALVLGAAGLYLLAAQRHEQREEIREAAVKLTPACAEKLAHYALASGERYQSPYVLERTGARTARSGYSEEDVRAIERGCNIIDDTQGRYASDPDPAERIRIFAKGTRVSRGPLPSVVVTWVNLEETLRRDLGLGGPTK